MNSVLSLLSDFRRKGIKVWAEGEKLRFKAPKGALTPELKARLRDHKAQIIAFFKEAEGAAAQAPIVPVPREGNPPLSFAQQRLWIIDQMGGSNNGYNIVAALRLLGPIHIPAMEAALQTIVDRHESLRTTFQVEEEIPVQVIADHLPVRLGAFDLTLFADADREAVAARIVDDIGRAAFDLARGPLARMALLRQGLTNHILIVTMHHIISDGWSIGVMIQELERLYSFYLQARDRDEPQLMPLPVQYADFTVWQRNWFESDELKAQQDYWQQQLAGLPEMISLPTDFPRPAIQTFNGREFVKPLGPSFSRQVGDLAHRLKTTPFTILLSAWYVLLQRYSGQEDLAVGTPVANRTRAEIEPLIGCFVNTLVLRVQLQSQAPFTQLLQQVQQVNADAQNRQDLPFEKLLTTLDVERNPAYSPLFQVFFSLGQRRDFPSLTGLKIEGVAREQTSALFDLTLNVNESSQGFQLVWEYNTDLFAERTIQGMDGHYRHLLQEIIDHADSPVRDFALVSHRERRRLVVTWNQDTRPRPTCPGHAVVLDRAEAGPDRTAVVFTGRPESPQLSYGALAGQIQALAAVLLETGVRAEEPVALLFDRSFEMYIAMTAVMHAGGAFVPLDPAYPADRISMILEDCGARLVLAGAAYADHAPGKTVIVVDGPLPETRVETTVHMDQAAYIIYTSGSTGRPKGVVVSHAALAAHMADQGADFAMVEDDRVLHIASYSFDASLEQWLLTLMRGAAIIAPGSGLWPPAWLQENLNRYNVTIADLPPAYWHQALQETRPYFAPAALRLVITGGEAMPAAGLELWNRSPTDHIRLVNSYGPTETVVAAVNFDVPRGKSFSRVPIGRRQRSRVLYVLNRQEGVQPVGLPGELFIGGPFIARGYKDRPARTAELFRPDPFSDLPGARLYASGDKVRYLSDGTLDFLGRIDRQLKLRGFRIEPGDIEAALTGHPDISQALVLKYRDRLVAYLVAEDNPPEESALRSLLADKLPRFMLPSSLIYLAAFPLTPAGKIDERALPEPGVSVQESELVRPRTEIERELATIWSQVLEVDADNIGIHQDFFELGGHSLLATRVVARIRDRLGRELPLTDLFTASTIAQLATRLQDPLAVGEQGIVPVPRDGDLPLSFAQRRLWFLDQLEGSASADSAYNMPAALQLDGALCLDLLHGSLQGILNRHEILRTRYEEAGGLPLQIIEPEVRLNLPLIDLVVLDDAPERAQEIAAAEAHRPFDLKTAPMLRCLLIRLQADRHILVATMHHIASDGWSTGLLVNELSTSYRALAAGDTTSLPASPVQYADYAAWQHQWLAGDAMQNQLDWWKQQLAPPLSVPHPAIDRDPSMPAHLGASVNLGLDATLRQQVEELAAETGATPFMVLLGAFKVLLSRLSGETDVVVGTPIAGRRFAELEPLIGCFLNNLVLRTYLADTGDDEDTAGLPCFRTLLERVRQTALDAFSRQDLPFEKLVEELQPARDLDSHPLFDIMFNLVNTPEGDLDLPGLSLAGVDTGEPDAKFLLNLYVNELHEGYHLRLVYRRARFGARAMQIFLEQFRNLLGQLLERPDLPVDQPALVDDTARRVTADLSSPIEKQNFPLIGEQFAARLAESPDAPALRFRDTTWTYTQLGERAGSLQATLTEHGFKPGDVVAVHGGRSAGLVTAMLAVVSQGGVLLNLDPRQPVARKTLLLRETDTRFLVNLEPFTPVDDTPPSLTGLSMDPQTGRLEQEISGSFQAVELGQDAPFYIFFTSGTTGIPKAMLGRAVGLSHFLDWQGRTFDLHAEERAGQLANPTFDAVLRDVFLPLTQGALLCIPPDDDILLEPKRLLQWLADEEISVLNVVPSLVNAWLLHTGEAPPLPKLRHIFLAGEPLTDRLVRNWRARFGDHAAFVNMYGTSETTLAKTSQVVTRPRPGNQPGGFALPGAQVAVVDRSLKPCGIGEPGEIVIRTPYRTLGYLNQAAENRLFIQNPFRDDLDDLLYRTGDRGRLMPDGNLEILGRLDFQVKVRGKRAEPEETAATMRHHSDVDNAAVIALPDGHGNYRLVAFAVLSDGAASDSASIHAWLEQQLPDHQVPAAVTILERFPLTTNGKVDRKRLAAYAEDVDTGTTQQYVAPQTPTQRVLAEVWSEVLGIPKVGIQDNFFRAGGHSLLAVQVCARIRDSLARELPVRRLFETPTIEALAKWLDRQAGGEKALPGLVPLQHDEFLPVSFPQQRLWFIDSMEDQPGSAYNMSTALRLKGPLDRDALDAAVKALVKRQTSLRTVFLSADGAPAARLLPETAIGLTVEALIPESAVEAIVAEEAERPFDLEKGPLFRVCLYPLEGGDHLLILVIHHIISDAWSQGILVDELTALYADPAAELPELPVQYADYAAWLQQQLQGEQRNERLAWWRRELGDAPALLELPTDRPRPAVQTFIGDLAHFTIPAEITARLAEIERAEDVTRFMTLQAAFAALLVRLSGMEDICVGTGVANRTHVEVERLIGFFVNTLVLRNDCSGNPDFRNLLQRVRRTTLNAYAHQETPFDLVVEAVKPDRDLSHTPLFQVMFVLENAPLGEAALPDARLEPVATGRRTSRFDITVFFTEHAHGIWGLFEYNTDLFDASTMDRMARHFVHLLEQVCASPDRPLSDVNLLSEDETAQLITHWNQTGAPIPQTSLAEQFHQQAARNPDAVAVLTSEPLTYGDLAGRAERLATRLVELGAGPLTPVGILLEPGEGLITAMLAVTAAGAAYVPMDPAGPVERQRTIMEDTGMPLIIATPETAAAMPQNNAVLVSPTDGSKEAAPQLQKVDPALPAYIMYTSGSTGKPKGTLIPHHGVTRLVRETDYVFLNEGSRVGQIATPVFDAATFEIWGPLLNGATVVPAHRDLALDTESFAAWLCEQQIDTLFITTALFNRHISERPDCFACLDTLLFGGEAVDAERVRRALDEGAPKRLLHVYGPTENTTFSTWNRVLRVAEDAETVPIGKPIANTTAYVLDRAGMPVPENVVGELHLGGIGLASGYLNRPALTAERFTADPFSAEPGQRLYRTGDLVRLRMVDDAPTLLFVGRSDYQIKLRGFRIELGEIEAALLDLPRVTEAVVLLKQSGETRMLAAFITGEKLDEAGLKTALADRLPDYMIPAVFVPLESFPLTAAGKLDRRALQKLETARPDEIITAPRNPIEKRLAAVFAELLGLPAIDIHRNFFDLGGHSLLATRAVSRIRQEFEVEIALKAFFAGPTVAALARAVVETRGSAHAPAPTLTRREVGDKPPLSFAQERLWFLTKLSDDTDTAAVASYNVPAALLLAGPPDIARLEDVFRRIETRQEALRTVFLEDDGTAYQAILPAGGFRMTFADLSNLSPEDAEQKARELAADEILIPFDLANGPVWRAALVRLAPDRHALLLNMHHIVSDGWSIEVLIREITALYSGVADRLPDLPVRYVDFAHWQRNWLTDEALDERLAFWKRELAGIPHLLALPTDKPRPVLQSFRGDNVGFSIPPQLLSAVDAVAAETRCTRFMVLEAVFAALLYRFSGQDDVVIGTPIANRNRAEVEPLIGFFVNTLVMRNDLADNPDFRTLLTRTRRTALDAFDNQDAPFETVVEALRLPRSLSHTPLFQVMFNLIDGTGGGSGETATSPTGLSLAPLGQRGETAKFDLSLTITTYGDGAGARLEYCIDLFERDTIAMLTELYVRMLQAMCDNPEANIAVLHPGDEAPVVHDLPERPSVPAVPLLIAERAQANPHAPALVPVGHPADTLTYAQLMEHSRMLAGRMQRAGAGAETFVGLLLPRGIDMLIAQLSVMQAGAAFIPLDPAQPLARTEAMLQDTDAVLLVTQQNTEQPEGKFKVILMDDAEETSADLREIQPHPSQTAYAIFTSGSTGRPKGVVVSHGALADHCRSISRRFELTPKDRVLQFANPAFDASLEQWLPALTAGAAVHVRGDELWPPEELPSILAAEQITIANPPPAYWQEMLTAGSLTDLPHLRLMILGGEALPLQGLARWQKMAPVNITLVNAYGPTEAVITATMHTVSPEVLPARVPIGTALPNRFARVLDADLQPLPNGLPGQLYLGGLLARGYANDPAKTAAVFIPDPFSKQAGARLYASGDLVRRQADGTLEFLGRVDQQVKLRGFRIEPGEVEARLVGAPGVKAAAVIAVPDDHGTLRLAAYAVAPETDAETIRNHLKSTLPDYMQPGALMLLDQLPRTAGGKIDRRALPVPQWTQTADYQPPQSEVEKALAEIWAEVLKLDKVGRNDQFFDLGGHSLLATRLLSRISKQLGIDLNLRAVFKKQSLTELAEFIEILQLVEPVQETDEPDEDREEFEL
ncbi:MAG: amino acid adenylation domain-containing protein [Acidobacteriota bacterium]|nr:amino acid adenylation domain-containing protein [Acidobacteriota bacterium]